MLYVSKFEILCTIYFQVFPIYGNFNLDITHRKMEYSSLYCSCCSKSLSLEAVLSDIRDPFHHWSPQHTCRMLRMLLKNSSQFEGFNSQIVFIIDPLGKRWISCLQGLVMTLLLNHYSLSVVFFFRFVLLIWRKNHS